MHFFPVNAPVSTHVLLLCAKDAESETHHAYKYLCHESNSSLDFRKGKISHLFWLLSHTFGLSRHFFTLQRSPVISLDATMICPSNNCCIYGHEISFACQKLIWFRDAPHCKILICSQSSGDNLQNWAAKEGSA